jgi:hypothetical protein
MPITAAIIICTTGCASIGTHLAELCDAIYVRADEAREMSRIRQETREELAALREEERRLAAEQAVAQARLDAQRTQMEMEFCRADQEALRQHVKSNIRDTLESRIGIDVVQGLEVGDLEVDVESLKQVLEQREREPLTQPIREPCDCCDKPCGCQPGIIRRLCPQCRHKPCEAEKTCGRDAYEQLARQPIRRPLRPAEIPLKLPVRLTFGMQNPQVEKARIRREPLVREPFRQGPCDCRDQGPAALEQHYRYESTAPDVDVFRDTPRPPTVPENTEEDDPPPSPFASNLPTGFLRSRHNDVGRLHDASDGFSLQPISPVGYPTSQR